MTGISALTHSKILKKNSHQSVLHLTLKPADTCVAGSSLEGFTLSTRLLYRFQPSRVGPKAGEAGPGDTLLRDPPGPRFTCFRSSLVGLMR